MPRTIRRAVSSRLVWRTLAVVAVACALFADGRLAGQVVFNNFDIRTEKDAASAAYIQRTTAGASASLVGRSAARTDGLARLQASFTGLAVDASPELGTPEVVSVQPGTGFLTAPSQDRVGAMREFLTTYADAFGLSGEQVASLELVANYTNAAGNMSWVEFEQKLNGIPVFRGLIRGGFTADGALARTTGVLAADLDAGTLQTTPGFSATEAVARAAESVGWAQNAGALTQTIGADGKLTVSRGTMAADARAWLVYFPVAPGVARLAWVNEVWGNPDVFMILLDAEDGTVLFRKNLTNTQTQAASYTVYNDDSPAPMSPSTTVPGMGTQAAAIARTTFTLIGNEPPNTFNNLGWITDGANGGNGWTDGNNIQAGIDRDGINGVDVVVSGVSRVFNFPYNPSPGLPPPGEDPLLTNYQRGEVTDGFYWSNLYHDRLYLLGFTEAARNFQNDNFGRGGSQADRISGEFQDSSGTNNANFSTPADGGRGRMQMYIFTGSTPDRTSGLDHDILIHELTHGTSNRLHNNASGLNTTMSGGMGEGWSDFYARAILSSASEDPTAVYSTGGWATYLLAAAYVDNYYYGIRRFPYAVKSNLGSNGKPHNPLTFADVDPTQINLTDGAYPRGPFGSSSAYQVHNVGEVWANALNEGRARFITRLGYAAGNQRFLQFVTDGMKLDPTNPTMLQGRDAIVAAANAGGGTAADIADIWAGFATRGMGLSAQVLNVNTGSVVEAFDTPGIAAAGGTLTAESIPNGRLDPGETVSVSLCITNSGLSTSGSVTGTLAATGGVTLPSGPQAYGPVAPAANVCRTYSFTVSATCGATVTATLGITESGGPNRNLTYLFQVGTPTSFQSQNFDGVTAPALPGGWTTSLIGGGANPWVTNTTSPDTAPNRAFANDFGVATDNALVSPVIAMPAGATRVTFRHSFATEATFDGGVLEISIAGGAYADVITAGGTFVSGGYTGPLAAGGAFPNRPAWHGNSGGYITTSVQMPAGASNQNVQLRWRMGTDSSVGGTGWAVDTVTFNSFVCGAGSPPGAFGKTSPSNGAPGQPTSLTLDWGNSSGAVSYDYCIDTSNNNACDGTWTSTAITSSVDLVGLSAATTYYWQVRALNGDGTTYADGSLPAFWSFTTAVGGPGAFSKSNPTDGATAQPTSPMLSWGAAGGATSYEYCIDTSHNGACNASWISTFAATSVTLPGLAQNTLYSWHVRAVNSGGTTYSQASASAFWAFTTGSLGPAFGQVDTPAQNAAGVQGAIGVTGWALDDTGVNNVKIYRNCLGFEPANCQIVLGTSVVYVGDAAFLTGARPDVAAAFPTHPQNNRAGWGYLMLTPLLPHVPNNQPYGGQGTLTLYVVATDQGGNQTLLGRTSVSNDPTTFSMTNDTIAKPFGAIDTPGQGQTISGMFANFGWAITPDLNTVADGTDILVPTNGSTMTVFIDGAPVSLVAYNQCRGTVGNPPPGGVYCNDDVSSIFGNPTPQPPLTSRTSNATKFRNLDAARGPIGAYSFDTNTLSNGLHTIAWSVTDSAGRNEGIGSRFFLVSNSFADPQTEDALRAVPGRSLGDASALAAFVPGTQQVWGRTGYALSTGWTKMHATATGGYVARLAELGRLEMWLGGPIGSGYLVANGHLHPLPVGSSVTDSQFAWMPPAGYAGAYDLAFIVGDARTDVRVTVVPTPRAIDGESQIKMSLRGAQVLECSGALVRGCVRIEGFAFDPQAAIGTGVSGVHVWAQRVQGPESRVQGPGSRVQGAPVFIGSAELDQVRPDAGSGAPDHAGFSLTTSLAPGTYTLTAYVWNLRTERWEDARSVVVTVR